MRTANGLPTLCITASQVGKDSMSEMDLNMNNLSGSAWKINTADLIFSVRTNKVMRENGKYEIKILKNFLIASPFCFCQRVSLNLLCSLHNSTAL